MKNITQKIITSLVVLQMVVSSTGLVSAQFVDDVSYGNVSDSYFSDGSGYTYSNYNPYTPVTYGNVSDTSFNNAATVYGNVGCTDCTTSGTNSGYTYSNYDPYTPVTYGNVSDTSFNNAATVYGNVGCTDCTTSGTNSGYTYSNYDPYTPVTYGNVSNTNFSNAATVYGNVGCTDCTTSGTNSGYTYSNYDPYTPVTYGNVSNTNFSNAATVYGNVGCVGCDTTSTVGGTGWSYSSTYVPTTVSTVTSPSYSYTPSYTYTSPTVYTTPTYTSPTYTTPTYTSPTYTTGNYGTVNYGYSTYTYPGTTYTPTTPICNSEQYLDNGVCRNLTKVCPDGRVIAALASCGTTITTCPAGSTLVNGTCQINTTTCPSGSTLINGTCQITGTSCPTGSTLINGVCQINTTVCPSGSTLINGVCQAPIVCPVGTTLTNGVCVGQGTTVCPTGSTLINGVCQINITSCPVGSTLVSGICQINGTTCPSGSVFSNGTCVITNTTTITNYTCSNGSVVAYAYQCPQSYTYPTYRFPQYDYVTPVTPIVSYQNCWNGSLIPSTAVCPSQFKVCANGTSIPINQTCYVTPNPVYVPPTVVKFNNVVTSVVTQITNTSGRCNGIGLIANGAPSTGWFEYGETANLGRQTAQAQIGSANTAPFSNVLASLKPTTKYYCRAVMQNQYGVVKGEIVSFITKSKAVTYVKPVTTTTVKKTVTKKNEVTCSDGTTVSVKNESAASLINKGEKLISLSIEKGEGKLVADAVVGYKVSYKNLADTRLTGVVVKVTLPQEINYIGSSVGSYDEATRVITLNQDTLDPHTEGMILVTGKIVKDAPVGKSIVTNVYAAYTVPSTHVQDEVTAYVVGSIVPITDMSKVDTGAKKVVGASSNQGFMPNSLIEWLALTAILFIIFILGRSVYASYKDEGESSH